MLDFFSFSLVFFGFCFYLRTHTKQPLSARATFSSAFIHVPPLYSADEWILADMPQRINQRRTGEQMCEEPTSKSMYIIIIMRRKMVGINISRCGTNGFYAEWVRVVGSVWGGANLLTFDGPLVIVFKENPFGFGVSDELGRLTSV